MTPSDAQRIERLAKYPELADWLEMVAAQSDDGRKKDPKDKRRIAAALLREAADLIARLRVDAERMRNALTGVLEWCGPIAGDNCDKIAADIENRTVAEARAALAATAPMRAEKEDGRG